MGVIGEIGCDFGHGLRASGGQMVNDKNRKVP